MIRRAAASGALLLLAFVVALAQDTTPKVVYKHGPDSEVQPGVPAGKVEKMEAWKSKVFPDTVRDCWPQQSQIESWLSPGSILKSIMA